MSSKRKSPPTKLEGGGATDNSIKTNTGNNLTVSSENCGDSLPRSNTPSTNSDEGGTISDRDIDSMRNSLSPLGVGHGDIELQQRRMRISSENSMFEGPCKKQKINLEHQQHMRGNSPFMTVNTLQFSLFFKYFKILKKRSQTIKKKFSKNKQKTRKKPD
jgi:hypothetical protein